MRLEKRAISEGHNGGREREGVHAGVLHGEIPSVCDPESMHYMPVDLQKLPPPRASPGLVA